MYQFVPPDGTSFDIVSRGKMFYLNDVTFVKRVLDLQKWHQILGHCNTHDILKLEPIVDGMKISKKSEFQCEPCLVEKQSQFVSKKSAIVALQLFWNMSVVMYLVQSI